MGTHRQGGFTLIELLVVVLILGVLVAVVVVNIGDKPPKARWELTRIQIAKLRTEVELFRAQHSRHPGSLDDLVANDQLDAVPIDAWGRPFLYRTPGLRGARFDIVSLGEDGQEGGDGYAADLWSHPPSLR